MDFRILIVIFISLLMPLPSQSQEIPIWKDGDFPKLLSIEADTFYVFTYAQTNFLHKVLEERDLLLREVQSFYALDSTFLRIERNQTDVINSQQSTIELMSAITKLSEDNEKNTLEIYNRTASRLESAEKNIARLQKDLEREKIRKKFWRNTSLISGAAVVGIVTGFILVK